MFWTLYSISSLFVLLKTAHCTLKYIILWKVSCIAIWSFPNTIMMSASSSSYRMRCSPCRSCQTTERPLWRGRRGHTELTQRPETLGKRSVCLEDKETGLIQKNIISIFDKNRNCNTDCKKIKHVTLSKWMMDTKMISLVAVLELYIISSVLKKQIKLVQVSLKLLIL